MKQEIKYISIILLLMLSILNSCKKEMSCEGCATKNNKPPIAIAGLDQVITLPTNSISLDLDGSSSHDPGIHTRHVCEVGSTQ